MFALFFCLEVVCVVLTPAKNERVALLDLGIVVKAFDFIVARTSFRFLIALLLLYRANVFTYVDRCEVVLISTASTVSKRLAYFCNIIVVVARLNFIARSHFHRLQTRFFSAEINAIIKGFKIISVSITSAPNKSVTEVFFSVVEPSSYSVCTRSYVPIVVTWTFIAVISTILQCFEVILIRLFSTPVENFAFFSSVVEVIPQLQMFKIIARAVLWVKSADF